mgnify:CR=1 FL=1
MAKLLLLCIFLLSLFSCEGVYYEVGVEAGSPYTYEICDTTWVSEYDIIERECVTVYSDNDVDYCVDLIDEYVSTYPEIECVVGDSLGYSYTGLHLTVNHLYDIRDGLVTHRGGF